ncbi:biliverdin-producing heme oxygenase [uncultured Idiomarina sp.]|uniref:biliverdin-producing heme oxygenase n=1 Tax=uncultured Idiomarina sp. TaxID=352961 RepID=UPI002592565F|nr:biliverdin-producing heme oxygenase [uncultured Idiomarina sp.]
MTSFPLLNELRTKTQKLHSKLEQESCFADLMKADISYGQYVAALNSLNTFLATFEPAIEAHLTRSDYMYQRRLWCVQSDLEALGYPPVSDIPSRTMTNHETMGAAYVIEGSTLGGKILHKRLQKQDFIANANALSYFSFYKENTWSDYINWLEKQSLRHAEYAAVCSGAINAR